MRTFYPDVETPEAPALGAIPSHAELPEPLDTALARSFNALVHNLGRDRVCQFAELLASVIDDTGYGSITVTVVDHRIQTIKQEKSFKP